MSVNPEELNSNMRGLIDALKSGQRPRERVTGQALEDIYASGKFRTATLRGVTGGIADVPQLIMAIRIVTLKEPGVYESAVVTSPSLAHRSREFMDKLQRDLDSLPIEAGLVIPVLPMLEDLITQEGLTAMAAQHLSRDFATKKEMGAVLYPRVFRNMPNPFPLISDGQRDSIGLAMATGVLKRVPFGRNPVNFTLPAR